MHHSDWLRLKLGKIYPVVMIFFFFRESVPFSVSQPYGVYMSESGLKSNSETITTLLRIFLYVLYIPIGHCPIKEVVKPKIVLN